MYFLFPKKTINPDDFVKLEEICTAIVKDRQPFERLEMSKENLLKMFEYNEFKKRIIKEKVQTPTTTVYRCGPLIGGRLIDARLVDGLFDFSLSQIYAGVHMFGIQERSRFSLLLAS